MSRNSRAIQGNGSIYNVYMLLSGKSGLVREHIGNIRLNDDLVGPCDLRCIKMRLEIVTNSEK